MKKYRKKICDRVAQIFIDAFGSSPQSLAAYCDHDIEKLCAIGKPAQADRALVQAIDEAVKEAIKLIMQPAVSQCGDSLDKLAELYEEYEEANKEEEYPYRKQEATHEIFGAVIENLIPSLVVGCEGDLAKLGKLDDKLPTYFKCVGSAGKTVKEAIRKIVEPLISECSDDLDKLVALYDGIIPLHSRTNFELNVRTRVKNLLPFAMVQCNGSVDELGNCAKD